MEGLCMHDGEVSRAMWVRELIDAADTVYKDTVIANHADHLPIDNPLFIASMALYTKKFIESARQYKRRDGQLGLSGLPLQVLKTLTDPERVITMRYPVLTPAVLGSLGRNWAEVGPVFVEVR
jgi:hypothetical protein